MFWSRETVISGGLLSYGPSVPDIFRRAASFIDKILKGERAADLPVEQPAKFELILNLKTAKTLGIVLPPALLGCADDHLALFGPKRCGGRGPFLRAKRTSGLRVWTSVLDPERTSASATVVGHALMVGSYDFNGFD